jgi:ABC-type Fe3+-hydroxamate transport system substrate-binding protein
VIGGVACDRPSNAAPRANADATRASVTRDAATDDFGMPFPTDARYGARVVSLNPAATEVIFAIGAEDRLIGRSRWDEFPEGARRIPALGDGLRPNVEQLIAARPTLVILYANAENRPAAEALARAGIRTLAIRVDRLQQFHRLVRQLGTALDAQTRAQLVSDSVQHTLDRVRRLTSRLSDPPRVLWPVWETPPMVIGGGSYLDELLEIAGGSNVFHADSSPSPTVSVEEIARRDPRLILASEATAQRLTANGVWRAVPAIREARFVRIDPKLTGRPSVVMGMAAVHLARLLHPTLADSLP